eukprot:XP_001706773.1 Hypothetical protein GL50803_32080 [Giardia lamblia ATCC 50803]
MAPPTAFSSRETPGRARPSVCATSAGSPRPSRVPCKSGLTQPCWLVRNRSTRSSTVESSPSLAEWLPCAPRKPSRPTSNGNRRQSETLSSLSTRLTIFSLKMTRSFTFCTTRYLRHRTHCSLCQ